jgi:hypothetical protein
VPVRDWFTEVTVTSDLTLRERTVTFLLWAYGLLLVATISIFFLQGFRLGGFNLDVQLLRWLGGATVGEIGGLLTLTAGSLFGRGKREARTPRAKARKKLSP